MKLVKTSTVKSIRTPKSKIMPELGKKHNLIKEKIKELYKNESHYQTDTEQDTRPINI